MPPDPARLNPTTVKVAAALAAVVLLVAVVVVAGRDDEEPVAAPTTTTSTTSTTEAITTTTEPDTGPRAPLTGLRVTDPALVARPALVAKIDNLDTERETALPQAGLARADVVFEEIVEGNITRLVAVFHSQAPGRIGPVRSARTTDVHLIPQLGTVLFVWSGGNDGVVAAVRRSPYLIDMGHDAASSSYSRERGRRAPHNLFVEADELWGRVAEPPAAPNALFEFRAEGQAPSPEATPARGVDLVWGGGVATSPVGWEWDPEIERYVRSQNGRPHLDADGSVITASNVVVLVTEYGRSAADTRSPEALTVGEGELFVYTGGQVVWGRWSRPAEDQPAALRDTAGNPVLLTPGTTWVEMPRSNSVTTRR
jgi:hypothetical protein